MAPAFVVQRQSPTNDWLPWSRSDNPGDARREAWRIFDELRGNAVRAEGIRVVGPDGILTMVVDGAVR